MLERETFRPEALAELDAMQVVVIPVLESPDVIAGLMRGIRDQTGERCPRFAFLFKPGDCQPWEDPENRAWARQFLDEHYDLFSLLVDEPGEHDAGRDYIYAFPGAGRLRVLAVAGYARTHEPSVLADPKPGLRCFILRLTPEGRALYDAAKGDTRGEA